MIQGYTLINKSHKLSFIQCDSTIRNIARLYPYDTFENDSDEKTLRGSSQEIAESMKAELQQRVDEAGLNIQEVRITHLSYSEEIAAAMLQRQQAVAVIAARQKIVEGAVSMVKMAIDQLSEEEIVVLDDERKAAMVSNLLVVLCGLLRLSPSLWNELAAWAEDDIRSINGQIEYLLSECVKQRKK